MIGIINYLKWKSALRHSKFREVLYECTYQYTDLITHNNVRWLSKRTAMARVWKLMEELTVFVGACGESAKPHIDIMTSVEDMDNIAFWWSSLISWTSLIRSSIIQLWSAGKNISDAVLTFQKALIIRYFPLFQARELSPRPTPSCQKRDLCDID